MVAIIVFDDCRRRGFGGADNGDTGEAETAVVSDLTVSIGYYKNGLFQGKALKLIGGLVNVDIGIVMP